MNWTIVIILGVIALVPTIYGMYLSRTPAFPDLMEPPEGYKGILPPKVENMRVIDPEQLPISPYTGEQYDPAWGTLIQKGGQSNRALLKLMKTIEAEQDPPQSVSGIIPWGQPAGDYPDPQAEYDDLPRATYPEERNQ